jgi:methylated-DNA-protein-cysteine methyltransferase related protein
MTSSPKNDNFFDKVYQVARQIPFGKVTSYGAIAEYLGAKRSARMVGWAILIIKQLKFLRTGW